MDEKKSHNFVDEGNGKSMKILALTEMSEDFLSSSTLHGMNKLSSGLSLCRRILWLIIILASAAYLCVTVIQEIRTYYTYPTTTNTRVEQETEMPFPSVTICNLSPSKRSAQPTDDPRYDNLQILFTTTYHHYQPVNRSDPHYQSDIYQAPMTFESRYNVSFTLTETFFSCVFDFITVPCETYIQRYITNVGPCFIFNKDGHLKTKRSGANANMLVYIVINQDEYYYGLSDGSGIKFVINEPGEVPDAYSKGLVVPPGTISYAAVSRNVSLSQPYKSFDNGFCLDKEDADFNSPLDGSNYTLHSCLDECIMEKVKLKCGCILPSLNRQGPFCSLFQLEDYFLGMTRTYFEDGEIQQCNDRCTVPCKQIFYDVKLSYGQYPSDFTASSLRHLGLGNRTNEWYRKNLLLLNVFYERLTTTYSEKVAVYGTIGDVLAKVGGQMGLFLGASLLTLTELFEFCVRLICYVLCKSKQKQKVQPRQ